MLQETRPLAQELGLFDLLFNYEFLHSMLLWGTVLGMALFLFTCTKRDTRKVQRRAPPHAEHEPYEAECRPAELPEMRRGPRQGRPPIIRRAARHDWCEERWIPKNRHEYYYDDD